MAQKPVDTTDKGNFIGDQLRKAAAPTVHEAVDAANAALAERLDHAEGAVRRATRAAEGAGKSVASHAADESIFVVSRTEVAVSRQIDHFFQSASAAKDSVMARAGAVLAPCLLAYALHLSGSARSAESNSFDFLRFATLLWGSTSLLAFFVLLLHLRVHDKRIAAEFLKWEFYLATLFGLVALVVLIVQHTVAT